MKKYIVVTNIWGKKEVTMWLSRDVFSEEREYFDTLEEARDFAWLFKEYAMLFPNPDKKREGHWKNKDKWFFDYKKSKLAYEAFKPGERLWGYVIGDTEECKVIEWGGIDMMNIWKTSDARRVKDYLFRGDDEIPKDYKWDEGEYEGWLQYRWGDGKNAVGYVEPEKPKKVVKEVEAFSEVYDDLYIDNKDREYDEIENSFLKDEDKEKLKRILNKW